MENPAHWSKAEKVIAEAMDEYENRDPDIMGESIVHAIWRALVQANLLAQGDRAYRVADY